MYGNKNFMLQQDEQRACKANTFEFNPKKGFALPQGLLSSTPI